MRKPRKMMSRMKRIVFVRVMEKRVQFAEGGDKPPSNEV